MANYLEASEEIQNIFDSVLKTKNIPLEVQFRVMENTKLKEVAKPQKLNDLVEALTDLNVVIVVNPNVFDELPEDMKPIVFEKTLEGISVDMESGKITITPPDFTTFSSLLVKHGDAKMIRFEETVKSIFEKIKAEEDQIKAEKKEKKAKKQSKKDLMASVI